MPWSTARSSANMISELEKEEQASNWSKRRARPDGERRNRSVAKRNKWGSEQDEILRRLIAEGIFANAAAVELRRSEATVRMRAKELGLKFAPAPRGASSKRI